MEKFMTENFLLSNKSARKLYHDFAENMPIIDYHCHISPKEIAQNKKYRDITEIWLGGDHYKWRAIRSNGIPEEVITGNGSPYDKFRAFAKTMPKLIGNPMYHWSHLELKRYFGYDGILNEDTCDKVWELCNSKLSQPSMSAREIITRSNVKLICTTDDPVDSLEYHEILAGDSSFSTKVLPAFRPDNLLNIEKTTFAGYIQTLSAVSGVAINTFDDLLCAVTKRLDHFDKFGCKSADHGLERIVFDTDYTADSLNETLKKALEGISPSPAEVEKYKTALLVFFAGEYTRRNWVMQFHYGVSRNNNTGMFEKIGPDTGFDAINASVSIKELSGLLNHFALSDCLPKTIIYSINPIENAAIGALIGCFQCDKTPGYIQQGSAWWFNDNNTGMREQMTSLANLGILGNFVGMLTDSRSFLSYTRHEYFRRILCDLVGTWVENGEYPADYKTLETIIKDISFNNTNRYFDFGIKL
ncbi:MAG: glucuronate isomerase [Clostridia bacterium]|nr:glucuronate isomerase [Clostridia bacterium]